MLRNELVYDIMQFQCEYSNIFLNYKQNIFLAIIDVDI